MITENKEKYISFNVDVVVDTCEELGGVKEKKIQLRFIDSIRFMASSLDSLTNNLVKDNGAGEAGRKLTGFEITAKLNRSYSKGKEFIRISI